MAFQVYGQMVLPIKLGMPDYETIVASLPKMPSCPKLDIAPIPYTKVVNIPCSRARVILYRVPLKSSKPATKSSQPRQYSALAHKEMHTAEQVKLRRQSRVIKKCLPD